MMIPFHVLPTNSPAWQVLLGRRWIQTTNFQMDWETRRYSLKVCDTILNGDSAEKLDQPSTLVEENPSPSILVEETNPTEENHQSAIDTNKKKWIVDEGSPSLGWLVDESLLKSQGYGKQWKACWLTKSSYQKISTQSTNGKDGNYQSYQEKPKTNFKWMPKKIQSQPTQTSSIVNKAQTNRPVIPKTIMKWVPKETPLSTKKTGNQEQPKKHQIWRPKQPIIV